MPAPTDIRSRLPTVRPPGHEARRRRAVLIRGGLALAVAALTGLVSWYAVSASNPHPAAGLFDVVDGRPYAAASGPGDLTVLSFLATQPDTANGPSRNEAVTLVSLSTQYHAEGLSVAIVDESAPPASTSALTNTAYDWQLGSVAMLEDPGHRAADRYGVTVTPSTYLLSSTGAVLAHWNGYVLTSTAASVIAAHLRQGPHS